MLDNTQLMSHGIVSVESRLKATMISPLKSGLIAALFAVLCGTAHAQDSLNVSPSSLAFAYQIGGPQPIAQQLTVSFPFAAIAFNVLATSNWGGLSVAPPNGTTPATIGVSVNTKSLSPGNYAGLITFNTPEGVAPAVNVTLSVTQGSQTIAFGALPNQPLGTPPFSVSATATSGLPVSFASSTTSVCSVSGAIVTLVALGTCTIQATQAGNTDYAAALPVNQSFQVTRGSQAIIFGALSNQVFGAAPFPVSATATSGLPVSLASTTTTVCSVSGAIVTLVALGTCTIQATQAGNADYLAAEPVNQSFQVNYSPGTQLQVSQTQLSFSALVGGSAPPPQSVGVVASNGNPAVFITVIDNGTANTPAPAWISIQPSSGATPGVVTVSVNQTGLSAGTSTARVRFMLSPSTTQSPVDVIVTLTVSTAPPQLGLAPSLLSFQEREAAPGVLQQALIVSNSGGNGPLAFTAAVVNQSPWISALSPASGQAAPNNPAVVIVSVNTQGLAIGFYRDVIHVTSAGGSADVPVTLYVAGPGPILSVDLTGVRFDMLQGQGSPPSQTIRVLNLGDPATTISWTANILSGGNWLRLGATQGTATATNPGTLTLAPGPGAANLPAGSAYALVSISDPAEPNAPQYVVAVLEVDAAGSPAIPNLSPTGLFFTATANSFFSQSAIVQVSTSSAAAVPYQAAAATSNQGSWLQVSPATGTASPTSAGQVTVTVSPSSLSAGVYKGQVNVAMSGVLRTADVTLVVTPPAVTPFRSAAEAAAIAGCVPSSVALTVSGFSNSFSTPAGWPAALVVQLNDNCANPVTNGSVAASFSNGDPPISLASDMLTGAYSATWQPGQNSSSMTVTLQASAGVLGNATEQISGAVTANVAPVLSPGGTLNNLNPVVGGALAPGTVAQVYGSELASATSSPGIVPLPISLNGTTMLVGGLAAPLYYLSNRQLVVQIPNELAPNRPYAAVVSVGTAVTPVPTTIDVTPVQPGVAAYSGGGLIAQHSADYSLVTASSPAHPGETVIIYLVGMGATNPAVASGQPAPPPPLAYAVEQPTVTVDGQGAAVLFAGLTPGAVGLFQIDFTVPASAPMGSLNVVIAQPGGSANAATLPVGP